MRILLTAAVAASLAAGTIAALAQTTPDTPPKPAKCSTLKAEADCSARTDCVWKAPTGTATTGKCRKAPKKKPTPAT